MQAGHYLDLLGVGGPLQEGKDQEARDQDGKAEGERDAEGVHEGGGAARRQDVKLELADSQSYSDCRAGHFRYFLNFSLIKNDFLHFLSS